MRIKLVLKSFPPGNELEHIPHGVIHLNSKFAELIHMQAPE